MKRKLINNRWLGLQINQEEISNWTNDTIVTIKAGTGKGKSHFIKNNLYASAVKENKKILMLIHRRDCVDQFTEEIKSDNKADVIDIRTYQLIESKVLKGEKFDFSKYSYIVCDEYHYFFGDAGFNMNTDISLNEILNQTDKVRIFMSATGDSMEGFLTNIKKLNSIGYEMDIEYDFIEELSFFDKDETMERVIDKCIKDDTKAIFFIRSAKKAYNLYKEYEKEALFNCSSSNDEYYRYVDKDKIKEMLKKERFEERILITTTTMEAGVNIKDGEVKHIICDVEDIGSTIQCIGRRRIKDDNDKINVYIKNVNGNQLGNRISNIKQATEMADYHKLHGSVDYVDKYGRNHSDIVYVENINGKTETIVNDLAYYKRKLDLATMKAMVNKKGYNHEGRGYVRYIANLFNQDEFTIMEEEYEKENIVDYLDSIVGVKLYKEEQEVLKDMFRKNGLKGRTVGLKTINGNIADRNLPYILDIGKRSSYRCEDGKVKKEKSHWILGKIVY